MAFLSIVSAALTGKAAAGIAATVVAGTGLSVAIEAVDTPDGVAEERLTELTAEGSVEADAETEGEPTVHGAASADWVSESEEAGDDVDDTTEQRSEEREVPSGPALDQGRADAVHSELTVDGELRPGDDGFGAAVSAKARDGEPGELGHDVAASARSQAPDQEVAAQARTEGRARAEGRSERDAEQNGEATTDAQADADTKTDADGGIGASAQQGTAVDAASSSGGSDGAESRGADVGLENKADFGAGEGDEGASSGVGVAGNLSVGGSDR